MSGVRLPPSVMERLEDVALVANTPGYVFHCLVADDALRAVAEKESAAKIVSNLRTLEQKDAVLVQERDALVALALAFALRYKGATGLRALQEIEVPWLPWWGAIRGMIISSGHWDTDEKLFVRPGHVVASGETALPKELNEVSVLDLGGKANESQTVHGSRAGSH